MRKRIIGQAPSPAATEDEAWLDAHGFAEVEVSSEDVDHPIEGALLPGGTGWRAAGPGPQIIRVHFAEPQQLRRIWLQFTEPRLARTQEYVLRWSGGDQPARRDIVRQQWHFSPQGATSQTEDHRVELTAVRVLELTVVPDIGGGPARASLDRMRLA